MTINNLVRLYQNLKLFDEAVNSSKSAIALFIQTRDIYNAAMASRNLARLYRNLENVELAQEAYKEAINLLRRCTDGQEDIEDLEKELKSLTKKDGLPWWAWLCIIIFVLILSIVIGTVMIEGFFYVAN